MECTEMSTGKFLFSQQHRSGFGVEFPTGNNQSYFDY
jgi:hypothetical protein